MNLQNDGYATHSDLREWLKKIDHLGEPPDFLVDAIFKRFVARGLEFRLFENVPGF